MKNSEIQALSTEELKEKLSSTEKALQNLLFANAVSPIENPIQIRDVRKFVARLKTELHKRVIGSIEEKVASGELTSGNARNFLVSNKFDSPITLAKLKEIIAKSGN